jgi:trk system potassium uptake protein TrkH
MSGKRPGDVRVRVSRVRPQEFQVAAPRRRRDPTPAPLLLIYGFLGLIAAGTALLMLPISTRDGSVPPLIDALFTATSASTVTGLVVVDTGTHWSAFGHIVLLGLIQAGGFGIMAGSTLLLLLLVRRGTRLRERVLVQETVGTPSLSSVRSSAPSCWAVPSSPRALAAMHWAASGGASSIPSPRSTTQVLT